MRRLLASLVAPGPGPGRWRRAAAVAGALVVGGAALATAAAIGHGHADGDVQAQPPKPAESAQPPKPAASIAAGDQAHGHDQTHGHDRPVATAEGPTPGQRAAADALLAATKRRAVRWATVAAAEADGYRPITPIFNGIQHWHNDRFHRDGKVLRPEAPEELVYASTSRGLVLVAAMYLMPRVGEPGPRVGGPLTAWHDHTDLCFTAEGSVVGFHRPPTFRCPAGSANVRTPEMLHVWVVENPAGPFAPEMTPSALVAIAEDATG